MSRPAHKHYGSHKHIAYGKVGAAGDTFEIEDEERSIGGFFGMMTETMGRKIQNGVYLIIMIAAVVTMSVEEDSSAAFEIFFSTGSSPWDDGAFQIEWLSVAIGAAGIVLYAWNTINYSDRYEQGVKKGFYYLRWFHFAVVASLILDQLYIMECYKDLGGLLAFTLVVFWLADSLGTQEHANAVYHQYEQMTSVNNPAEDVASSVRKQRWVYYLHSFAPLIGCIGLVFSQGIYYGIKGTGSMPTLFKVYIGLNLAFLLAISILSAAHNFRFGVWRNHGMYEGTFLFIMFAWSVVALILVPWIMHQNNDLNYCQSTVVNTVN